MTGMFNYQEVENEGLFQLKLKFDKQLKAKAGTLIIARWGSDVLPMTILRFRYGSLLLAVSHAVST